MQNIPGEIPSSDFTMEGHPTWVVKQRSRPDYLTNGCQTSMWCLSSFSQYATTNHLGHYQYPRRSFETFALSTILTMPQRWCQTLSSTHACTQVVLVGWAPQIRSHPSPTVRCAWTLRTNGMRSENNAKIIRNTTITSWIQCDPIISMGP